MKTGDSVKIKKGIRLDEFDNLLIEGWEGRVLEIEDDFLKIALDSLTLSKLPETYIIDSLEGHCDYTEFYIEVGEVEKTNPRDTESEVVAMKNKLEAKYPEIAYSLDEEDQRIFEVLKTKNVSVNEKNLEKYYEYLEKKLTKPIILTGMEDFKWEEPYVMGGWDQKEYEELKKTKPSYTDQFEFLNMEDYSEDYGIYVNVKRLSDKKKFTLPLWDLKVIDKKDPNYLLVSDFSSWMTNFR